MAFYIVPSGFFDKKVLKMQISKEFAERINSVISCPDNQFIPRVEDAGKVIKGLQIMHNGLKINLGSYYGPEVAQQLFQNKGVHEPQEERVFQEVLKIIPENSTMIELGAFWSFYSMWFNSKIQNAKNYMIEPEAFNMESGIRNFALNGFKGHFTQAFIGKESGILEDNKVICIDDFVKDNRIKHISILHSDIQGYEYDMLQGAEQTIDRAMVDFIFISTHTNEVHYKCLVFLKNKNFTVIAAADLDETFAEDGLIVAYAPHHIGIAKIDISLRKSGS